MLTFIPDVAEEHFEELQFLWSQRRHALRSAAYTMREMAMLEERIEAHVQGLLVIGADLLDFVAEGLDGDDAMAAFAAASAAFSSARIPSAVKTKSVRSASSNGASFIADFART